MTPAPLIALNSAVRQIIPPHEGVVTWRTYVRALAQAGAMPIIIPPTSDETALVTVLERLDGLVFIGGYDLPPEWYGQELHPRTRLAHPHRLVGDRLLAEMALSRDIPILGICMGFQLLNVILGGDLLQDIPSQLGTDVVHAVPPLEEGIDLDEEALRKRPIETFHQVRVQPGSRLAAFLGQGQLEVNSSHHQALGRLGQGLQAVGWAPDGVIEAVEGTEDRFLLAVQWHPERIADRPEQQALFRALVRAAGDLHSG